MSDTHYLFGIHAVQAALEHEPETVSMIWLEHGRRDERARRIETLAREHGIPLQRVKRDELDARVDGRHQGVVARSGAQPVLDETALYARLEALDQPPLLLVLDGVQDPHNLGACLRTADAAGAHAVIAPRDKACGLTSTVRKVACGAAETVPFVQVTNLVRCLKELKTRGIWIVGTDVTAETVLFDADLAGPLALVLGAEGKGMRRLTREACDSLVTLPMCGSVQSLNVSVSAGICLYEALRQRRRKGSGT
jgi:23S rRNA (guanosine2251-2'-O)-methyltransferase